MDFNAFWPLPPGIYHQHQPDQLQLPPQFQPPPPPPAAPPAQLPYIHQQFDPNPFLVHLQDAILPPILHAAGYNPPAAHLDHLQRPPIPVDPFDDRDDYDDEYFDLFGSRNQTPQPQNDDPSSQANHPQGNLEPPRHQHHPPIDRAAYSPDNYIEEYLNDPSIFGDDDFHPPSPSPESDRRELPETSATAPIDLTSSPTMPPTKKRKRGEDGSLLGSSGRARQTETTKSRRDSVEVVDLEDVEEKEDYEAIMAKQQAETVKRQNEEEANRPVKLAEFQCIICMDNPTNLTVTHCGHLFCSECLHSALHAGDKKCCPVCRSTISLSTPNGRSKSKNGAYALEMKLMTVSRKGKQPVKA